MRKMEGVDCIGGDGEGRMNKNEGRMIECSTINGMKINNTFWKQYKIDKYTYICSKRRGSEVLSVLSHIRKSQNP